MLITNTIGAMKIKQNWLCFWFQCHFIIKGEKIVWFRRDHHAISSKSARKEKQRKRAIKENFPSGSSQEQLFNQLRSCRQQLARIEKVPPYIIFNDVTLIEMVNKRPATPEEFSALTGVGAVKLERYGAIFLDLLQEVGD